jgi:hypothetical protein
MTPSKPSPEIAADAARLRAQVERANAMLADDEVPSPAVRAAVLAAAARQVNARPQGVGAKPRWRAPLAAAASVLVGTLAVVLAMRHDAPANKTIVTTESAPAPATSATPATPGMAPPLATHSTQAPAVASAREQIAQAPAGPPSAAPPAPSAPSVGAASMESTGPAASSSAAIPGAAPAVPAPAAPASPAAPAAPSAQADVQREQRDQRAERRDLAPAAPPMLAQAPRSKDEAAADVTAAAAAKPPTLGSNAMTKERAPAPAARTQGEAGVPAASSAASGPAPTEQQVRARPVQRTAPMNDTAAPAALPALPAEEASRWITRIVELRRAGRQAEADAELKALRERAPTLAIPPEALPRAGTR